MGKYSAFFLLSTIKFLFAPFGGPASGLTFLETYVSCVLGAIISSSIFYFSAEYFLKRSREKAKKAIVKKKVFTKTNRSIVKLKHKLGIYGVAMYIPLFFSIPVGSIITAKFYGKYVKTYPIILLGIFVNGLITTGIAYLSLILF